MDNKKYKKVFLDKVFCYHIAPHDLNDFYKTHFTRGQISAGYKYFFLKQLKLEIYLTTIVKFFIFLSYVFSIYFWVNNVRKISQQNQTHQKFFLSFYL